MRYRDFVIRVRDFQVVQVENPRKPSETVPGHSFIVEVAESPLGRQVKPQEKRYPKTGEVSADVNTLRGRDGRKGMTDEALQFRCGRLAENLLPPNVLFWLKASLFQAVIRREGLRVIFWLDDPETAELPWEYLYVPLPTFEIGFLALSPLTTIIRDQAFFGLIEPLEIKPQRRALFGIAEPTTLSDLDKQFSHTPSEKKIEDKKLAKRLKKLDKDGIIQLDSITELTEADLIDASKDKQGYDMFYFYGHGGVVGGNGLIVLQKNKKQTEDPNEVIEDVDYNVEDLAWTLRRMGVQVAVLAACKSGLIDRDTAGEQAWRAPAPTLLEKGRVPVVVGMQADVSKLGAFAFTESFFQALALGLPLEEAVTRGRIEIRNLKRGTDNEEQVQFSRDWGLPALYMHTRGERNLTTTAEEIAAFAETKNRLRAQASQVQLGSSPYSAIHTRNFTGRIWALQEINEWLDQDSEDRPQILQIIGPPGSGRTALATYLTEISVGQGPEGIVKAPEGLHRLKRGFLNVIHFCSKHHSQWNTKATFTESVALQLAVHSRAYADILETAFTENIGNREAFIRALRASFDPGFAENLLDEMVILIDALDVADKDLAELIEGTEDVPRHIRFIITTDTEWPDAPEWIKKSGRTQILSLDPQGEHADDNREDIKNYVGRVIKNAEARGFSEPKSPARLKEAVLQMSQGIFLLAVKLFDWVEATQKDFEYAVEVCHETEGLDQFNKKVLQSLKKKWDTCYGPILGVLAFATRPLRAREIAERARLELDRVVETLEEPLVELYLEVAPSLLEGETTYALYHPSLADYLRDRNRAGDAFAVDRFAPQPHLDAAV